MNIKISWSERFINFYTENTKLYLKGERKCKSYLDTLALESELAKQLQPLFKEFYNEAFEDGYKKAKEELKEENK